MTAAPHAPQWCICNYLTEYSRRACTCACHKNGNNT